MAVENRPGANANLAAELVARSSPDGYMVLVMSTRTPSRSERKRFGFVNVRALFR